ncbi:MAG: YggT family protein [Henriciella sp.]|nr:YggT family protein [Henriciella sp.]
MRELLFALHSYFFSPILWIVAIIIIAYFVFGWLFTLGIIESRNMQARQVYLTLQNIVEPMCRPIRQFVPPLGNFDLAPLVLLLFIQFANGYLIPRIILLVPF